MNTLKRQRTVRIGSLELRAMAPDATADRIARSFLWRKVVKPAARLATSRTRVSTPNVPRGSRPAAAADSNGHDVAKTRQIIERIAPLEWYHSIDLGHGVVTPGFVDHRNQLAHYALPESLAGLRCLDVATYDGFWAFEMERRGAAEVVALDVARWADCDIPRVILDDVIHLSADKQTGAGFAIAHELLGSKVRREICNVYDCSPKRLGKFDFVIISDLLLHLRNPQLALERVFSVCRGTLLLADVFHPRLERYGDVCLTEFCADIPSDTWWRPNTNTLKAMMSVAGFQPVEEVSRFVLNARSDEPIHKVVLRGHVPAAEDSGAIARHLPASLEGLHCLVVGAPSAAWARELERRGAVDVVAAGEKLDDLPAGGKERFDLVLASDLLSRVQDPQLALERLRSLCGGTILVADRYNPALDGFGDFCFGEYTGGNAVQASRWLPSINTLKKMMLVGGFEPIEELARWPTSPSAPGGHRVLLRGSVPAVHSWQTMLRKEVA